MTGWHRHSERVLAAGMALALQVALYRLLLPPQPARARIGSSSAIVAMILRQTRPYRALGAPRRSGRSKAPMPRPRLQAMPVTPITAPQPPRAASPPIDWQAAMGRIARAETARTVGKPELRFGFPRRPPRRQAPPAFGWDKARIDRIQRLENGIIDLGDRCVINLSFPIPICRFGRIPANGDLFKHMHDPRNAQGSLP